MKWTPSPFHKGWFDAVAHRGSSDASDMWSWVLGKFADKPGQIHINVWSDEGDMFFYLANAPDYFGTGPRFVVRWPELRRTFSDNEWMVVNTDEPEVELARIVGEIQERKALNNVEALKFAQRIIDDVYGLEFERVVGKTLERILDGVQRAYPETAKRGVVCYEYQASFLRTFGTSPVVPTFIQAETRVALEVEKRRQQNSETTQGR